MFTKQVVIDGALAVGLLSALTVVFIVDREKAPPPVRELAEGEEDKTQKSLIGSGQPTVRKKNAPKEGSIYAERVAENRQVVAQQRGASPISEMAVNNGLAWLARHQAQDGSWSDKCIGRGRQCEKGTPCGGPGHAHDIAQTGLALLAFQGGGHFYFNESEYSTQVKRGLDWLLAHQRQDGCFAMANQQFPQYFMYEHAIATFALAEACALAKDSEQQVDRKYHDALVKAVDFIEKCQDPSGGGWRYSAREPGDTSISGWVMLALKSTVAAGVKVEPAVLKRCIGFFERCENGQDGRTGYTGGNNMVSEATTGIGMLVHHFLLEKSDTKLVKDASSFLARYAQGAWGGSARQPADYYIWYNCTLGMYLAGGDNWTKWNEIIRKQLENLQVKTNGTQDTNCERGSWPPVDQWSDHGGRIYSTALAILTLEVYYRFAKKGQQQ